MERALSADMACRPSATGPANKDGVYMTTENKPEKQSHKLSREQKDRIVRKARRTGTNYMSYREIGEAEGVNPSTVHFHVKKAGVTRQRSREFVTEEQLGDMATTINEKLDEILKQRLDIKEGERGE
jgi:transposase-like protein